ncbi:hypothetical protein EAO75_43925 [Streptomyces sp. uw30]|nr:hypothetical protein EAO75_43925 [Streptomyces sp. uw30]
MPSYGGVVLGDCTDDPAASWAYKGGSGGTYRLVNEHTGQCLAVSTAPSPVLADCGQDTAQSWRTGSGGTLQNMSNSKCLEYSSGWPVTNSCTSGSAVQRWKKL